jgi:excisionase family DNA binding protein
MSNLLSISDMASVLGVTPKTVRLWEKEGKITSIKTEGGHRRFYPSEVLKNKKQSNITIGYARVSTSEQKDDLDRQKKILELYCAEKGWECELISDIGSGINYNKKGLERLIKLICLGEIERLVVSHKDRLLRFGSEIIFSICEQHNVEIVIINKSINSTFEEELTNDVLEIITVFSAKLYGSRSHKNKKIIDKINEVKEKVENEILQN